MLPASSYTLIQKDFLFGTEPPWNLLGDLRCRNTSSQVLLKPYLRLSALLNQFKSLNLLFSKSCWSADWRMRSHLCDVILPLEVMAWLRFRTDINEALMLLQYRLIQIQLFVLSLDCCLRCWIASHFAIFPTTCWFVFTIWRPWKWVTIRNEIPVQTIASIKNPPIWKRNETKSYWKIWNITTITSVFINQVRMAQLRNSCLWI